ncbi:uncharacterized protein [Amphiura filiformis]|uniref:uncharacterized protein n=1 Tax=Amphiura filiformis TaxID=82378 RepID=UPI003B216D14
MEPGSKMNIEIKIPYAARMSSPQVEYSVQAPGQDMITGSAPVTVRQDSSLVDSGTYVTHDPGSYTVEVSPSGSSSHHTVRKETRRYVTQNPGETVTRRYVTTTPTETTTRRHYTTHQPVETVTRRYVTTTPPETTTRRYVTTEPEQVTRRSWVNTHPGGYPQQSPQETIITGGNIHVIPTTPISPTRSQTTSQDGVSQYTKTTTTTKTTREIDTSETGSVSNAPQSSTVITSQPTQVNRQSSRVEVDENRFQVTLDVGQYRPEDIEVKVDNNKLTVRAEAKGKAGEAGYVEKEFFRQYTLPDDVDTSQVRSYYSEDGNLTLEAPRIHGSGQHGPTQTTSFNEPPRLTTQPPRMSQGTYTYHSTPAGGGSPQSIPIHMRVGAPQGGGTVPIVEEVHSNYGSDLESNRSWRK